MVIYWQKKILYSCCHATIARKNMRCLLTAVKHVDNIRAIARQLLGKQVPAATNTHSAIEVLLDYNNEKEVFCGPCWNVVSEGESRLPGSSVREAVKKRVSCKSAQLKVRLWREDFTCDICSVQFSETVIVRVLNSVSRRRLVETVTDRGH
jgi:hypothetical protein